MIQEIIAKVKNSPMPTSLENDLLFKEVLTHPHNRDKLIYFLSTFTDYSEEYLKENNIIVKYESVFTKTKKEDKALRGDILIEFDKQKINLECYSKFNRASFDKSLMYVLRVYSTSIDRGEAYDLLAKVVGINLIDNVSKDTIIEEKEYSRAAIVYDNNIEVRAVALEFYRLDKLKDKPYNKENKKERWLRFVKAKDYKERKIIAKGDKKLMELNEWMEDYITDEHTKKVFGKWAEKIAYDKGVDEGVNIGINDEKKEIIMEMLKNNESMGKIQMYTKLPLEEIKKIEKEMK